MIICTQKQKGKNTIISNMADNKSHIIAGNTEKNATSKKKRSRSIKCPNCKN